MSLASPAALSVLGITGRDTALGDSANYYTMTTPTPGTGIISNNGTTAVATTPSLVLFNAGVLNVYLMYLRLSSTVVGGGAATKNFTFYLDQANRYTSGGTALVSQNTNMSSNAKSSLSGVTGAITAAAASPNQRTLMNDWFRVALADVVGDVYEWQFGAPSGVGVGSSPATVANFVRSAPPIVLQPQNCFLMNIWSSTFTQGITWEVQIGYAEK
jgi:hypothetical protein